VFIFLSFAEILTFRSLLTSQITNAEVCPSFGICSPSFWT
jgi:hypothetical protein